jgi:DNA invertase Pin-like site-specific DNA recombinase
MERPRMLVAGYFRISQARDEMKAPDIYRDEIERYCRYKDLHVVETFSDIDYSGYRGAKPRPGLEQLKARRFEFSSVIIPRLSRFGRSMKDLVALFDLFDRDDIGLVFLDINVDTSTSQGRLLRNIMAAFAEYESDVKSDYARANQRLLAQEGRPQGPLAPYGYVMQGSKGERTFAIDPERAGIVREIFERYAAGGEGFSRIARDLNARNVRGTKGGLWTRERARTLIDNPAFVGLRAHGGETYKAAWPAIVSKELWDRVRDAREFNRSKVRPREKRRYLLSGLITCGVCGRRLQHHTVGAGRRVYECRVMFDAAPRCLGGQVMGDRAERLVIDAFFELLSQVTNRALQGRAAEFKAAWGGASVEHRRSLLSEVIEKVELVPRPPGNRHSKGAPIGRSLKVLWCPEWSRCVFGYSQASSLLTPQDQRITSPRGKTWGDWRRARLIPR